MAWQFKKAWPTATSKTGSQTDLELELMKTGVQEVFTEGGGYTLVLGRGVTARGAHGLSAKQKILEQRARAAGCIGPVRLLAADKIASWASSDPAALFSLRPQIQTFTRADLELEYGRHAIAFEPDQPRIDIIENVAEAVLGSNPTTYNYRIQGLAGVGKTRLALEAAKHANLASVTLYSSGVPSRTLFNWVAVNEQVRVNLIVDECDEDHCQRLVEWASHCNGRLRLITVGPGMTSGEFVLVLNPLSIEAMERVVAAAAPLPDEQIRWVAAKARGYVKLAVLVAQAIARGTRSVGELGSDLAISNRVKNLLAPTEEGRRALQGVALLTRVGFRDDVAEEGQAIARFMGLSWCEMRHLLGPAQRQGIVITRGRYWYISPELLAIWLASEVWDGRGDQVLDFAASLPNLSSQTAFYERLGSLHGLPEVERVVAELMGPTGPFDSLSAISYPRTAKVFSVLAKGHPMAALQRLENMFSHTSHEDLLDFRDARSELVWILQALAQYQATFFPAGRLLRRLAEAENQTYSNNATGVWGELFLLMLAQTEVPALERLVLIDEAMASDSPSTRRLAVVGLASALARNERVGVLGSETIVPPAFWKPQTWDEVRVVKRASLTRLVSLMSDPAPDVALEARAIFRERVRELFLAGLSDDLLPLLASWQPTDDSERRKMWNEVQWLLRSHNMTLPDELRHELERVANRLFGSSLEDRTRRYLGPGMIGNWRDKDAGEPSLESVAVSLAEEAYLSPNELEPLLPWLFSGEAYFIWEFALRLGELDGSLSWLERLCDRAATSLDPRLLSGYLIGRENATGESGQLWRIQMLDSWASEQKLALAVIDATLRGDPSDHAVNRLFDLIDRGWMDASLLGWLRQDRWLLGISQSQLSRAVDRMVSDGSTRAVTSGLEILARLVERNNELPGELQVRAWQLLDHPAGWSQDLNAGFWWKTVARSFVDTEPLRVAETVLSLYRDGEPSFQDPRLELVVLAARHRPREVWAVVGNDVMQPQRSLHLRWDLTEINLVLSIPSEIVEDWIRQQGSSGAKAVAAVLKIPDKDELPQLARFLIREHSTDVGDILFSNFWSGSWVGTETTYLSEKLRVASNWTRDAEPSVRAWATKVSQSLESRVRETRVRDEEEFSPRRAGRP